MTGTGVGASITGTVSWSDLMNITQTTTIESGASVTVGPGTMITVASGASLVVKGTLTTMGSSAQHVKLSPATAGSVWGGVIVQSGGSIDLNYTDIDHTNVPLGCSAGAAQCKADHTSLTNYTGVGMQLATKATLSYMLVENGGSDGISGTPAAGETVTITDSVFHVTGGDAIVMNGAGNLTFDHNRVYGNGGAAPGQHCACHFDSTGTFLVTYNNFEASTFGLMASSMSAQSKVNNNNFINNPDAYGPASGNINPGADLTNNYWNGAAPPTLMGNSNTTPYSTTLIVGTGPR
jgi:hypothetical protein